MVGCTCQGESLLIKTFLANYQKFWWTFTGYWLPQKITVFVLWREEGYTVKYSLSKREIPRAEPEQFPEGSVYISPYIPTWVIIQTFSMSKSFTSNMSFLLWQYWMSCFSVLVLQLGYIFPHCPVDETIRVRIDPVENSAVAELGNTHFEESNTRKIKFQYYPLY